MSEALAHYPVDGFGAATPVPSVDELLEGLDADPIVKAVLALAFRGRAETDEPSPSAELERPSIIAAEQELVELRSRNDELAAALGACYLCWGDWLRCPHCGGLGRPGSRPSDPAMYAQYVQQAATRHVAAQVSPPSPPIDEQPKRPSNERGNR